MVHARYTYLIFMVLLALGSACRKISDYFRAPDTEVVANAIVANLVTGYTANTALSCISGNNLSHVDVYRSNDGFPCTSLMTIDISQAGSLPFPASTAGLITVAGLWADESTGILTILISDYDAGNTTISLLGIETVPVIRHDENIIVALADIDISLDPDQESILELNLTEMEIQFEFDRLESVRPHDVYVAIEERAYFIDVDCNSTPLNLSDDSYTITGGGQLVEATNTSAEIIQQAMVEVQITPMCPKNPTTGMALIQATGSEANHFPELGSVLFQFHHACDGQADVLIATGMYLPANGSSVSFNLQ